MRCIDGYEVIRALNDKASLATKGGSSYVLKLQPSAQSQEVRALRALFHPSIVALEDVLTHDGEGCQAIAVLEYIPGQNLYNYRRQNCFSPGIFYAVALQLCEVFRHIHAQDYVHNDLSPANAMLRPNGTLTVIDFGGCVQSSTQDGSIFSTPGYRCPQQIRGLNRFANDIFGMGAVLYFLIERCPPFDVDHEMLPLQHKPNIKEKRVKRLLCAMLDQQEEHRPTLEEAAQVFASKA